jgi:methyl-accepting chemotaxis protein
MAKTHSSSSFGSPTRRDWLMPVALVLEAALALALAGGPSAPPLAAALVAAALGVGLWGSLGRTGMPAAVATALSLITLVAVPVHLSPLREVALANAFLAMSLLPMLQSPALVLFSGGLMVLLPLSAKAMGLVSAAPSLGIGVYGVMALLVVQTLALASRAVVAQRSVRERFDIEFLVRAMGAQESIRLDFDVVKAETGVGRRLKQVQERMAGALRQARAAADGMQADSQVLQSGSEQLRERTERSAAGLRDAAMTLEQITTIVQASANAAMEARVMADSASSQAREGAATFAQVSQRMHDIDQSSRKITDIVGVIDGIAFQTNILALNAAVEAARAGDQGRGFAVVAAEVRNLALRASQAAGEVKVLINTSMETVRDGTELVRVADGRIQDLVASVSKVGEVFASLSADTSEHAGSIDAVTRAVMELDELTRQNVVMAETTQGIAADLLARGTELDNVLGAFKVGGSTAVLRSPEPARPTAAAAPARPAPKARRAEPVAPVTHSAPAPSTPSAPAAPASGEADNVTFF